MTTVVPLNSFSFSSISDRPDSRYDLCYKCRRARVIVYPEQVVLYFQVTFLIVDEGKSVSLVYMLRRRCAEKKPVIWYDGRQGYIFVDDGVYKMTTNLRSSCWTLVDSDQALVASHQTSSGIVLVFLSSTPPLQTSTVGKTVDDITVIHGHGGRCFERAFSTRYIVIVPTISFKAWPILLPGTQLTDDEINETFEPLGPTPRIIRLLSNPDSSKQYQKDVDIAVSEITPDKLKEMVNDAMLYQTNSVSLVARKGELSKFLCALINEF